MHLKTKTLLCFSLNTLICYLVPSFCCVLCFRVSGTRRSRSPAFLCISSSTFCFPRSPSLPVLIHPVIYFPTSKLIDRLFPVVVRCHSTTITPFFPSYLSPKLLGFSCVCTFLRLSKSAQTSIFSPLSFIC